MTVIEQIVWVAQGQLISGNPDRINKSGGGRVYGDLNFCHRLGSTIFPFIVVPLRVARTSVTGRSSTATASARALLGLWLLERSLTWVYSPFALIPTTPPSSLSIHWARSSSLMLMQRAHGLLIGSPAMPPITPTAPTLMTPHTSCAAWRRFWQGRSWNFLILGLSFP